jgi:serine/threonine protein kinase
MEYFENGDLARYIPSISTEDEVRQITTDLLEGLRIMHAEGFAHRDLKPQVSPYNSS